MALGRLEIMHLFHSLGVGYKDGSGNTQIVENACYIQPASAGPSRMTILLATKPFTLHFLKTTLLTHQT